MIAPMSMDALAEVAKALGFELHRAKHAEPGGVDYDRAIEQTQFALLHGTEVAFDGTSRECAAFLIGWRKLRSSVLGAVGVMETATKRLPDMAARTSCVARDTQDRRCLKQVDHEGLHATLWQWGQKP